MRRPETDFLLCYLQAPPGVKRNLMRTYESWNPEYISKSGSVLRAQALFALAWFHAVVQERRIYIPQVITPFIFSFFFTQESLVLFYAKSGALVLTKKKICWLHHFARFAFDFLKL